MRRVRCPWCDSLNTAEFVAGNRDGITATGHICDDCDSSWDGPAHAKAIKAKRLGDLADATAAVPQTKHPSSDVPLDGNYAAVPRNE